MNFKRNILITGGAGFIGSNFVHYWSQQHPEDRLLVLDKLTYAGCLASIQPLIDADRIDFVKGDINNGELIGYLLKRYQIRTIVHFAAESHVDRSIDGPEEFVRSNVNGTLSLLLAAKQAWDYNRANAGTYRFHHVSTDEVYGMLSETDPAFSETTPYDPSSPYSASKAASDHLVRSFGHTYGLPYTISNCSNNYGPFHFPEKLIPLSLTNLLQGKPIGIYGKGQNIRDWLFVSDHCYGIDLILQKGEIGQSYNIGGNNEQRNIDLITSLCQIVDRIFLQEPRWRQKYPLCPAAKNQTAASAISYIQDRPGHDWRYAIDATKISHHLGYQPQESLQSGLEKTVLWYLERDSWWRPLLA